MLNWRRKLSSRKLWACVTSVVICSLAFFNLDQMTVDKIVALVGAIASLNIYIFAEASVDKAKKEGIK